MYIIYIYIYIYILNFQIETINLTEFSRFKPPVRTRKPFMIFLFRTNVKATLALLTTTYKSLRKI